MRLKYLRVLYPPYFLFWGSVYYIEILIYKINLFEERDIDEISA